MELVENLNNNITNKIELDKNQSRFLESTMGKVINTGINLGLRAILPDLIENQIIEIKDTLLREGLKEGINKAISSAIDLGKSAVGIVTGNFDNISQAQVAVQKGGIIDGVSDAVDFVLIKTEQNGVLSSNIARTIRNGKNTILNTVSNNIENEFNKQLQCAERLQKYSNNWKRYFENKNFEGMTKELYKINNELKQLMPMEKTIKDARTIQNLHSLIKNNGKDFDLSEDQKKLAEMLK